MSILEEADKTINGERQDQYGSPEDSFLIIAEYWNVYLKSKTGVESYLTSRDVAKMMALFKIARMAGQKYSRDNWRDAIGYLAIDADRLQVNGAAIQAKELPCISEGRDRLLKVLKEVERCPI